ncbi:THAP domain-containing protein 2-like isoform X2 [Armigeres subalbatus]|uniref:THAP domain-containing protein 2-like isoform X2 n=1 Tax=Armigeres subalbatus TaxID=124917 RepID=UPI002ED651F5
MGKICAAVGCNQKAPGSLFRFPHDPVRREKWLVLCDEDLRARERKVSQFQHRRLCWKHFEPWCFVDADNPSKGTKLSRLDYITMALYVFYQKF